MRDKCHISALKPLVLNVCPLVMPSPEGLMIINCLCLVPKVHIFHINIYLSLILVTMNLLCVGQTIKFAITKNTLG